MKQFKIRCIARNNGSPVYGITISKDIAEQYIDVYFDIQTNGSALILTSGGKYEDLRRQMPRYSW